MAQLLKDVWQQVESLLDNGISVIPVRDKDFTLASGKIKLAKSPYDFWTDYQTSIIEKGKLWHDMNAFDTTAIATICGKVSGNLEGIDIDVKHKPGVAALLFKDIQSLLPEIYNKLRVHKTPSSGYHIPYRITDHEVPKSLKISGRCSTEEELKIKPKEKIKYFIETRGEGGYLLAPPSMGYSVHINKPIPFLTWDERCSLVNICLEYNEIIKIEKKYEPTKTESNYYEQNPFDDFNANCDPVLVLTDLGYTEVKHNSKFIWFTRPEGSKNHIHISFNQQRRFYRNFSSNSYLDEKGYTPSNLVGRLKFNDDKKQLYKYLVNLGYGKINEKIEQDIVKKGKELPTNASDQAKQEKQKHELQQQEIHPYGVFWEFNDKDKLVISRERLYDVSEKLGFRLYKGDIVRIISPFIYEQSQREYFDIIKSYIKENDGDLLEDIYNTYESFLQESGKFTISRLVELDLCEVLEDTREVCNKFYTNGFLHIDAQEINLLPYSSLDKNVFHKRVLQREYNISETGAYTDFLSTCLNEISENIQKTIGYLAHEYKDETTAYIVVCVEKVLDPKHGGGSGKNIFCQLFENTTTYKSRMGAGAKFDQNFFQVWNYHKIFCISDVDKNFDFTFLKEPAGGNIQWKRLFKNEESVGSKDAPKLIIQTNFSYEISDGGLSRRIIPIEFTDFYTRSGGVKKVTGKHFPKDWNKNDWADYDTFTAKCIQKWINSGRELSADTLSDTGWEKQFMLAYGQTIYDIIQEFWNDWLRIEFISNEEFKNQTERFYSENNISPHYRPTMVKINKAITEYCAKNKVYFNKEAVRRKDLAIVKGKLFGKDGDEPAPF